MTPLDTEVRVVHTPSMPINDPERFFEFDRSDTDGVDSTPEIPDAELFAGTADPHAGLMDFITTNVPEGEGVYSEEMMRQFMARELSRGVEPSPGPEDELARSYEAAYRASLTATPPEGSLSRESEAEPVEAEGTPSRWIGSWDAIRTRILGLPSDPNDTPDIAFASDPQPIIATETAIAANLNPTFNFGENYVIANATPSMPFLRGQIVRIDGESFVYHGRNEEADTLVFARWGVSNTEAPPMPYREPRDLRSYCPPGWYCEGGFPTARVPVNFDVPRDIVRGDTIQSRESGHTYIYDSQNADGELVMLRIYRDDEAMADPSYPIAMPTAGRRSTTVLGLQWALRNFWTEDELPILRASAANATPSFSTLNEWFDGEHRGELQRNSTTIARWQYNRTGGDDHQLKAMRQLFHEMERTLTHGDETGRDTEELMQYGYEPIKGIEQLLGRTEPLPTDTLKLRILRDLEMIQLEGDKSELLIEYSLEAYEG